jgi:hypothetical protein
VPPRGDCEFKRGRSAQGPRGGREARGHASNG